MYLCSQAGAGAAAGGKDAEGRPCLPTRGPDPDLEAAVAAAAAAADEVQLLRARVSELEEEVEGLYAQVREGLCAQVGEGLYAQVRDCTPR